MEPPPKKKAKGAASSNLDFTSLLSDLTAQFSSSHARPSSSAAAVATKSTGSSDKSGSSTKPAAVDIDDIFGSLSKPAKKKKHVLETEGRGAPVAPTPASFADIMSEFSTKGAQSRASNTAVAATPTITIDSSDVHMGVAAQSPIIITDDQDMGTAVPVSVATMSAPREAPGVSASNDSSLLAVDAAPAIPRILSAMLAGAKEEVIAAKLSRSVALDVATGGGGGGGEGGKGVLAAVAAARRRPSQPRLPAAYASSVHGLRIDGGPRQHGLKPMGVVEAMALAAGKKTRRRREKRGRHEWEEEGTVSSAAAAAAPSSSAPITRLSLKRSLGLPLSLDQLRHLNTRWSAYAWSLLEAHAKACGMTALQQQGSVGSGSSKGPLGGGAERGSVVLESLLRPAGKLKATVDSTSVEGVKGKSGRPNLSPSDVQRLLTTSLASPGGVIRAIDLHFALMKGELFSSVQ